MQNYIFLFPIFIPVSRLPTLQLLVQYEWSEYPHTLLQTKTNQSKFVFNKNKLLAKFGEDLLSHIVLVSPSGYIYIYIYMYILILRMLNISHYLLIFFLLNHAFWTNRRFAVKDFLENNFDV